MKTLFAAIAILTCVLPVRTQAAGLHPWEFGMSKEKVISFKEFGPYKDFPNGDVETFNWPFDGRKANVQFFFKQDRLWRIGVYLFEGADIKQGIPAWVSAYKALQKQFGEVVLPGLRIDPASDPVTAESLAIAATASAKLTGKALAEPAKQPKGMRAAAEIFSGVIQGKKYYFIALFYDAVE